MVSEPIVSVMDATPESIRLLGNNLRERDMVAAKKLGVSAHRTLWRIYKKSLICKIATVDGQVVAAWGLCGTFLGKSGRPWFVASPFVEGYPMKLAFRYRSELKGMLKYFPILEDWVCAEDNKTIKFLSILGFRFEEPFRAGKNDIMFMRAVLEK